MQARGRSRRTHIAHDKEQVQVRSLEEASAVRNCRKLLKRLDLDSQVVHGPDRSVCSVPPDPVQIAKRELTLDVFSYRFVISCTWQGLVGDCDPWSHSFLSRGGPYVEVAETASRRVSGQVWGVSRGSAWERVSRLSKRAVQLRLAGLPDESSW